MITKESRSLRAVALIGMSVAALVGSAHAAVYSVENFEGGTPAYIINGINGTGAGQSWELLTASTAASVAGTGYNAGATSRVGIVANNNPTDITPGGVVPTGQHAFVSTSSNRTLTSNYAMTLATDGIVSLNVSFAYMFYALANQTALGSAVLTYSALGDFSDTVQLASFGFGQAGSAVVSPDYAATEEIWSTLSLSFTEADANITFTDTAAIRINRVGLVGLVSPDTTTNHIVFLDDITVSGTAVPEPATSALFALAGFGLLLRRRK